MRRRKFITLFGGATASWPLGATAQQDTRVRRIAVLTLQSEGDPYQKANLAALRDTLASFGWLEGRNLRVDVRSAESDAGRVRRYAAELVSLAPDVIVVVGGTAIRAIQELTQSIPIVFAEGGDPVVIGFMKSLARPEGNITGFSNQEPAMAGKWLALLKEAVPHIERTALIFNSELLYGISAAYISSIEAAAQTLGVRTTEMPVRDSIDLVRAIDVFAAAPNGSLLVLPPPPTAAIRDAIIRLAEQHRLPTIFINRENAAAGGLMSYGSSTIDQWRRAAGYVDRLLRGAKVSELPVQFPTKFELVVNLKAAKAIDLAIPESFLLRADEVLE